MKISQIELYRDQQITVHVDYTDAPISGELIAVASPVAEDPIGAHTAAVLLRGDGAYVLIDAASITSIRPVGSWR